MQKSFLTLIFCLIVLLTVSADDAPQDDIKNPPPVDNSPLGIHNIQKENNIYIIDQNNYKIATAIPGSYLMYFYAPWCGHCQTTLPIMEKVAEKIKQLKLSVTVIQIDATASPNIGDAHDIQSYPTIKLYNHGLNLKYEGTRSEDAIIAWLLKRNQQTITVINSAGQAKLVIEHNPFVCILFKDINKEAHLVKDLAQLSNQFTEIYFGYGNFTIGQSEFHIKQVPELVCFRDFQEPKEHHMSASWSIQNAQEFINTIRYPTILSLTKEVGDRIFSHQRSAIFLFAGHDDASEEARIAFKQAAPEIKGKTLIVITGIQDSPIEISMAEFLGITTAQLPAVYIMDTNEIEFQQYHYREKSITPEGLINFVDSWLAGELKPTVRGEPIPENEYQGNIRIVVAENAEQVVFDKTKDVFLYVYTTWCAQCQTLDPIYQNVAQLLRKSNPNIVLAQVDAMENELDQIHYSGFPSLLYFKSKDKTQPIAFDGDRTENGFLEFIQKHTSFKYTPPPKTDM